MELGESEYLMGNFISGMKRMPVRVRPHERGHPRAADPPHVERLSGGDQCRLELGDPANLLPFFAADATYGDVASGTSWRGHDQIARFYEHMLAFARDTHVEYQAPLVGGPAGWWATWTWTGAAQGRITLDGELLPRSVKPFSVRGAGVATTNRPG